MAEQQNGAEMLSALMGEQGADALQMLRRMERLKRLMGVPRLTEQAERTEETDAAKQEEGIFTRNRSENMISAAIPFLDREYQKDIYVVVRLMEMRRVLGEEWVESRERQGLSPKLRRKQMLTALRPYLAHPEQSRLDTVMKLMELREIMEQERER